MRLTRCLPTTALTCVFVFSGGVYAQPGEVTVDRQPEKGKLAFKINGDTALAYQYADEWAIPHLYPVRSPSGKLLTSQVPDPFPHHHSLYIADELKFEDHGAVDFYHDWQNEADSDEAPRPYKHFIDHESFAKLPAEKQADQPARTRSAVAELTWKINFDTPVLDDRRTMRVTALGEGEYLIDLKWTLTAAYGDVRVTSDWVHYGWPFVRMHPQFSGKQGGTITASDGDTGQKATNKQYAKWIDYSNTVDGKTEGLAIFIKPTGHKHKWLTRAYGTFGPRRRDELSGTNFVLEEGDSISGHVGILIHNGDVKAGDVAERYQQYVKGKLR